MPSESTKRCSGSTILKQSSLMERTPPTSVTPPLAIRTRTPLPPEITPLPTPIPRDPISTLTEPHGPRKPLNPTDYSLFGDTQARWVSSRIDPVLLSHREVLHYNPTHVFAPLVLTFFLLVCRIFLFALAGCASDGPCCFRGVVIAFDAENRFGRARLARCAGRELLAYIHGSTGNIRWNT